MKVAKRESFTSSRELKTDERPRKIKSKPVCLMCGKTSLRLICVLCAGRLKREALREEIEDEKQGKRPIHLVHN